MDTPSAGTAVTVAYLKARLDDGKDQLGIFMPLVLDVLPTLTDRYFAVVDVQNALSTLHNVAMPQEAVMTLLKRATRQGYLIRQAGRFALDSARALPHSNVAGEKAQLRAAQARLGMQLQNHASRRGVALDSPDQGLEMLLAFMQEQQTAMLLGSPAEDVTSTSLSPEAREVIAEFVHDIAIKDPALKEVVKDILAGLVLYHAAFLPDLSSATRHFKDLTVVFDSVLVRQTLGYEGPSPMVLMRETISLLKGSNVRCVVFDKTVGEIHRILRMYETKLATQAGRASLIAVPMARHFLTQRYAPSDVREMSVRLEQEIESCGFRIVPTPARVHEFTYGEAKLADRLSDPRTRDTQEPRVLHDVDCVAAVLTMRRNHRSQHIEDAKVVFATTASLVIKNTRLWWEEDEKETGVPPMVHIRSLANIAWLKKPAYGPELHLRDLVALCAAAMRPSQRIWQRFLTHLNNLQGTKSLTADEAALIISSTLSDSLLRDVELELEDADDVDAGTLDEVVERVTSEYSVAADRRVAEVEKALTERLVDAETKAEQRTKAAQLEAATAAEKLRRWEIANEGRAQRWASRIVATVYWPLIAIVIAGSLAAIFTAWPQGGWVGALAAIGLMVITLLEIVGALDHVQRIRALAVARLQRRLKAWLTASDESSAEQ